MKISFNVIVATLVIILIGTVIFFEFESQKPIQEISTDAQSENKYTMPILKLPLSYFSKESIRFGSADTKSDDEDAYTEAAIDEGYHSFPTTTISLKSDEYNQKKEKLGSIKTDEEIYGGDTDWKDSYPEQIEKYGDLARRFLPDTFIDVKKIDVDSDGVDESIISLCMVGGNHCPHGIIIVKGDNIIFSTSAGSVDVDIVETKTHNGFYLHWVPGSDDSTDKKWSAFGLCCSPGYMKTRFVFEDGKFKPVYEQEVLFFNVENTK